MIQLVTSAQIRHVSALLLPHFHATATEERSLTFARAKGLALLDLDAQKAMVEALTIDEFSYPSEHQKL